MSEAPPSRAGLIPAGTTPGRVEEVLDLCRRRGPILIVIQDDPDPDALASAAALRELVLQRISKRAAIGYGGACVRAENRAMLHVLRIPARHIRRNQLARYRTICLVDAQPSSGNSLVDAAHPASVVIDHHLKPPKCRWTADFADVRTDYGAASTILYEYLKESGVKISAALATALFYGIQSDTQDLGREAGSADVQAYQELFLLADKKRLAHIRNAPLPLAYFRMLAECLANCEIAGKTVISHVHACEDAGMLAEVADRLARIQGIRMVVCFGVSGNRVQLSARASDARSNVAGLVQRVVRGIGTGGGHHTMAGGQVPIGEDVEKVLSLVHSRVMHVFAKGKRRRPLIETVDRS